MRSFALTLVGVAHALNLEDFEFLKYVAQFGKDYNTVEEFDFRQALFAQTSDEIRRINTHQSSHIAGHNKFSDYSPVEYTNMLGLKNTHMPSHDDVVFVESDKAASTIDWRLFGKVTEVKD